MLCKVRLHSNRRMMLKPLCYWFSNANTRSTLLHVKPVLSVVCTVADYCVIAQALIRFPREGADDLRTWLMQSHWQLRTTSKCMRSPFCCLERPHTELTFDVACVDYQIFERISSYDAKREYGILARRKYKRTTDWLRSDETFNAWLEKSGPTSHLWISGKGTCTTNEPSLETDTSLRQSVLERVC
jgi:hypothetical protein